MQKSYVDSVFLVRLRTVNGSIQVCFLHVLSPHPSFLKPDQRPSSSISCMPCLSVPSAAWHWTKSFMSASETEHRQLTGAKCDPFPSTAGSWTSQMIFSLRPKKGDCEKQCQSGFHCGHPGYWCSVLSCVCSSRVAIYCSLSEIPTPFFFETSHYLLLLVALFGGIWEPALQVEILCNSVFLLVLDLK